MQHDAYAGLAERYDAFFGRFGQHEPERVAFYRDLFAAHGVHSVLDCACGTGNDLHLFHELGCAVSGSDISDAMLAQARRNLASVRLDVPLARVDYRDLLAHYPQPFDAVVCLSTSIAHMPDEAQALRALQSMYGVLRDGGILVLSQGTSDRQWREKPRFLLGADTPELTRLFVIDYLGRGARYNIVDVLHGPQGGEVKVWSAEYAQMLLRDDQERLLRQAGFAAVDFYGSYTREPYSVERSPRLIAVARRC